MGTVWTNTVRISELKRIPYQVRLRWGGIDDLPAAVAGWGQGQRLLCAAEFPAQQQRYSGNVFSPGTNRETDSGAARGGAKGGLVFRSRESKILLIGFPHFNRVFSPMITAPISS